MSALYWEKTQSVTSAQSAVHVSFAMSCISYSQKMHIKDYNH